MDDLISRKDAIKTVAGYISNLCMAYGNYLTVEESERASTALLRQVPSAERKGEWVRDYCSVCCSECSAYAPCYEDRTDWLSNYCPNCGARMKGGQNE